MAPRLRVSAGTSPASMTPITSLVNTSRAHHVSSPLFDGRIVVHIKGMTDEKGRVKESEYFERGDPSRAGVTWSIQVQGRFLMPYSADDILFGNTFDRPLKLPWGTSAVLKFMHYIDPTLEHDLTSSSKPWALSPLIATMPHFMHTRLSPGDARAGNMPRFPTRMSIGDDTSELYLALEDSESSGVGYLDFEGQGQGEDEDELEGMNYQESRSREIQRTKTQPQVPSMFVTSPPVPILIPGPVPPIPATSRYNSSQALSTSPSSTAASGLPGLARNGSVSTVNSTSTMSSFGSSSSSTAPSFLGPSSSSSPTNGNSRRGQGSSRLSVSSSLSTSSTSSASSGSSSSSGSGASGSTAISSSSTKSTRSSGLSSIRMKTKDVVRKVKGKKLGGGASAGDYEARRRKEEELKALENAAQRRAYFASKGKRKDVVFGPEDVITTDFCYGFINFAPSLALQLPGGLSFDLMKYWDGQPVRFVCCERPGLNRYGTAQEEKEKEPWGRIFWCVAIEIVDDDDDEGDGVYDEEE